MVEHIQRFELVDFHFEGKRYEFKSTAPLPALEQVLLFEELLRKALPARLRLAKVSRQEIQRIMETLRIDVGRVRKGCSLVPAVVYATGRPTELPFDHPYIEQAFADAALQVAELISSNSVELPGWARGSKIGQSLRSGESFEIRRARSRDPGFKVTQASTERLRPREEDKRQFSNELFRVISPSDGAKYPAFIEANEVAVQLDDRRHKALAVACYVTGKTLTVTGTARRTGPTARWKFDESATVMPADMDLTPLRESFIGLKASHLAKENGSSITGYQIDDFAEALETIFCAARVLPLPRLTIVDDEDSPLIVASFAQNGVRFVLERDGDDVVSYLSSNGVALRRPIELSINASDSILALSGREAGRKWSDALAVNAKEKSVLNAGSK